MVELKRGFVMKRKIKVAKSSYSPTKAEKEKAVKLPRKYDGQSFDAIVEAVIRPVEIEETDRPEK